MAEAVRTEIIECPNCQSRVRANVISEITYRDWIDDPVRTLFLRCQGCGHAIVAEQNGYEEVDEEHEQLVTSWGQLQRAWPSPHRNRSEIPEKVRIAMEEADRCLSAKAYNACVVMSGRALESICRQHSVETKSLGIGLKELKQKGVIDTKLYEWGEVLRKARNIGAHATDTETSRQDAHDVVDFTNAIAEYIYILSDKYQKFSERQKRLATKKSVKPTTPNDAIF